MSRVSNLLQSAFRCVAVAIQRVALCVAAFFATLFDVLQIRCVARSGAEKPPTDQEHMASRHTATLLLSYKNIITYVHTYACVYRGSIGTGFEMLRPRFTGSAGALS